MSETKQTPSINFTYNKYCGRVGFSNAESWNFENDKPKAGYLELGRCQSKDLQVRPRELGESVMLAHEESGEEFWLHLI
jgi:hypothetical protein